MDQNQTSDQAIKTEKKSPRKQLHSPTLTALFIVFCLFVILLGFMALFPDLASTLLPGMSSHTSSAALTDSTSLAMVGGLSILGLFSLAPLLNAFFSFFILIALLIVISQLSVISSRLDEVTKSNNE